LDTAGYRWFELRFTVRRRRLAELSSLLFRLGVGAVEERSLPRAALLVTYFEVEAEALRVKSAVESTGLAEALELIEHEGREWATAYVDYLKPEPLGERFLLIPEGHALPDAGGRTPLWFEPGHAFGVGSHATTRLASAALERRLGAGGCASVLDVGTGTGVLALIAACLGASRVVGVDIHQESILLSRRSALLNGMAERVEFVVGSADAITERFSVVVANIEWPTWQLIGRQIGERALSGGKVIATGVVQGCRAEAEALWSSLGWTVEGFEQLEDWCLWELGA